MKHQITHITPIKIATIFAIVYIALSLPFMIFTEVWLLFSPILQTPRIYLIGMPFLYGIIGFITTFIGAVLYNFIASKIGGIEFTTVEVEDQS